METALNTFHLATMQLRGSATDHARPGTLTFTSTTPDRLRNVPYPAELIAIEDFAAFTTARRGNESSASLADRARLDRTTITALERGDNKNAWFEDAAAIYQALGGRALYLAFRQKEPRRQSSQFTIHLITPSEYATKKGVGGLYKEQYQAQGLLQTDIAQRMGIRQSNISQFANAATAPNPATIHRYFDAINIDVSYCGIIEEPLR